VSWSGATVLPMVSGECLLCGERSCFSGCRVCDGGSDARGQMCMGDGGEAVMIRNEYGVSSCWMVRYLWHASRSLEEEDCVIGEAFRRGLD
jgi:hypothetical protein